MQTTDPASAKVHRRDKPAARGDAGGGRGCGGGAGGTGDISGLSLNGAEPKTALKVYWKNSSIRRCNGCLWKWRRAMRSGRGSGLAVQLFTRRVSSAFFSSTQAPTNLLVRFKKKKCKRVWPRRKDKYSAVGFTGSPAPWT